MWFQCGYSYKIVHKIHNNVSPYAYKISYEACTKSRIFTLKNYNASHRGRGHPHPTPRAQARSSSVASVPRISPPPTKEGRHALASSSNSIFPNALLMQKRCPQLQRRVWIETRIIQMQKISVWGRRQATSKRLVWTSDKLCADLCRRLCGDLGRRKSMNLA